jgi:hypothetical protein
MPIRWRITLYIALVVRAILLVLGLALYFLSRGLLLSGVENIARTRAIARRLWNVSGASPPTSATSSAASCARH